MKISTRVLSICLGMALSGVLTFNLSAAGSEALAVATFVRGKVYLERNGKKKRVRVRTIFNKNDRIFTKKGMVNIQIGKSAIIRLSKFSILEMKNLYESGDINQVLLEIKQGRLYSKITRKVPQGGSFHVQSPTAVAGVRGTEFMVSENTGEAAEKKLVKKDASIESGIYVNEGEVSVASTTREEEVQVQGGSQVLTNTNELKQQILDGYVKRKMEIFAKLKLMKEKNYEMLKKQQERGRSAIEAIKNKNKELREKMDE